MPYRVDVGEPGKTEPTFRIPFWTRRRAEREAAIARTKRGVGFIVIPEVLSLSGKVHPEGQTLWADVERIGWRECWSRKMP